MTLMIMMWGIILTQEEASGSKYVAMTMIRKRYYIPKNEIYRAYYDAPDDRKAYNYGFKDYIDEDDE